MICSLQNFNPRSREGSDQRPIRYTWRGNDFNPRSREGSDYCTAILSGHHRYFNPRSREGSDVLSDVAKVLGVQFQSTLP